MSVVLAKEFELEAKEPRDVYCETLLELAEKNPDIVILDADLMGAMGTKPFAQKYPGRTVDCGVQEANMIGVACGLAAVGKVPFAHTFAAFATRRACDQIFMSGAYAGSNVKIVGSDPGIMAQINGGTHMPFEDMGIMRGIPTMTLIEPTDNTMLKWAVRELAGVHGMHYMRVVRKSWVKVYKENPGFEIGKAVRIKKGRDVTIIASGYCVAEAVKAARTLEGQGVDAGVLDMFCWKPLDAEAVLEAASATGAIVTAENHNVINGLGSAVAEVLARNRPAPLEMIGIQDEFGEVGYVDYLSERFRLNAKHIVEGAKKAISRK